MPTSIGEMPASANGPVEFHPLTVNDQDHLCLRRGIHPPALIGFDVSPSYVNKDGILREPFALIPLGAASTAVAVGTGIFLLIKRACQ